MSKSLNLKKVYAILFLKGKDGISLTEIGEILDLKMGEVKKLLEELNNYLLGKDSPFILKNFENVYWISISPEISVELAKKMKKNVKVRLTKSLVETLAIIAYNQPVVKSAIEKIRGSSADYAISKLISYDLIEEIGRDETKKGSPRLFITTSYFLILFDLKSLKDLPEMKEEFQEKTEEIQLLNYDDKNDFYDEENKKQKNNENNLEENELIQDNEELVDENKEENN